MVFIPLVIICEIFMPSIISILAPGFIDREEFGLLVDISRIIFPYLIVIVISSVFIGSLNSDNKFGLTAALPIFLNLAILTGILTHSFWGISKIQLLSLTVLIGGFIQLICLFYSIDKEFWRSIFSLNQYKSQLKKFLKLVWPTFLSASSVQLNLTINMIIASFFTGAMSYLHFAQKIYWLPLTVIGIAIGSVLIPNLTNAIRNLDEDSAKKMQSKGFQYCNLVILPATFGLFFTADLIIASMFERGEFGSESTKNTALILQILSLGLPASILVKVFVPYFFAMEKPKIPMKVTGITVLVNLILTISMFPFMSYLAIPLSLTISAWTNLFLILAQHRKINFYRFEESDLNNLFKFLLFSFFLSGIILATRAVMVDHSALVNLLTCLSLSFILWLSFIMISEKEIRENFRKAINF
jgi:putative peptidoglycan lipid II flippase